MRVSGILFIQLFALFLLSACAGDNAKITQIDSELREYLESAVVALDERDVDFITKDANLDTNLTGQMKTDVRLWLRTLPVNCNGQLRLLQIEDTLTENETINYSVSLERQCKEFSQRIYFKLKHDLTATCCILEEVNSTNPAVPTPAFYDFSTNAGLARIVFVSFLAFLVVFYILQTMIVCLRAKNQKYKFAWVFFISIGIHGLFFNWTTGDIGATFLFGEYLGDGIYKVTINYVDFAFLGVDFTKSDALSPWFLSVHVPWGALIFRLFFHKRQPST